jgi:predicted dithiol-disulfide oxidoreductase (DUF899 family)
VGPGEGAHTQEGDAIAAARRRLAMVEVGPSTPVTGEHGKVQLLDVFEAQQSADVLLAGRWFGKLVCYLRDGDRVLETYWTTGRGGELMTRSSCERVWRSRSILGRGRTAADGAAGPKADRSRGC